MTVDATGNTDDTPAQADDEPLLFDTLNVGYDDAHGYYAEIPAGKAEGVCACSGNYAGFFCQIAATGEIPCAEGNAAVIFGKVNPRKLRSGLEGEAAAEVVIDASRWPFAEDGYSDAVDAVLRLGGDPREKKFDYPAVGITEAHIPELVQAVCDIKFESYVEGDPYEWAGVHPLLALETYPRIPLGAARALIGRLPLLDDGDFDEWFSEHAPGIIGKIGEGAIPLLLASIEEMFRYHTPDNERYLHSISTAVRTISIIGVNFPELRGRCIQELVSLLMRYARMSPALNGFIVTYLADLKAVEAIGIIEMAFEADCVDISIMGDLEDVRIELGLQKERTTPRPRYHSLGRDLLESFQRESDKIGRNDPCPCGSGKKHKKCCGKNG